MRTLLLVNPRAKKVARRGSALLAAADALGMEATLVDESFQPTPADRVFIEGGDGTVSDLLGRWIGSGLSLPRFALVAGGMTNQVAGVVGLRARSTGALQKAIATPSQRPTVEAALMEVEATSGDPDQAQTPVQTPVQTLRGFVFSTGVMPRVTERVQGYRDGLGMSGGLLVGRALFDAVKPNSPFRDLLPSRLEADLRHGDGRHEQLVISGRHLGTFATTLPSLYLGLDPFWGKEPGAIRVTHGDGDARALASTVLGQWLGRKNAKTLRERGFQSFNTDHLHIQTEAPVALDGEVVEGDTFTVRPTRPVTFLR